MTKQTKKPQDQDDDIARDHSLMSQINGHTHVFGFTSMFDNIVAACEDKVSQWQERLEKAKKIRKSLGDSFGKN